MEMRTKVLGKKRTGQLQSTSDLDWAFASCNGILFWSVDMSLCLHELDVFFSVHPFIGRLHGECE